MRADRPLLPVDLRRITAPRRGLRREEAAEYIAVSPSKFDQLVKDGRMPKPKNIDARKVWDLWAIDLAFTSLSSEPDANPWDGGAS